MTDQEDRRRAWARGYLGCDENGEPTHREPITEWDLIEAMKAEAKHHEARAFVAATSPEMLAEAERQAVGIRERGIDCTAEEIVLATSISNMVETTITLQPHLKTKATSRLGAATPDGLLLCLTLARCIPWILAAKTTEEQAAALNSGIAPVLAALTKKRAADLSKLTP